MTQHFSFDEPPRLRLFCGAAIAILLGFVAIAGYTIVDAWRATWTNAVQSSENLTATLAHDIDRNITLYDLSMQTAVAGLKLPDIWKITPEMRSAVLFDGSTTAAEFGAMFVVNESGDPIVSSRPSSADHLNFANEDYFLAQRDHPNIGLFISAPFQFKISREWAVAFSRRIDNPDGSFGGIVFGSVKLGHFRRLFDRVNLGPSGTITLLRSDGLILMRKPLLGDDFGRRLPDFAHFHEARSGNFQAAGKLDGVKRLFVYQQVGDLPLIIAVAPTTDVIFAEWERKAGVTMGVMLGLIGLAAWLLLRLVREFHRRAEAERRTLASEQRFRDFAESCGDWFWETGPDHRFRLYAGNPHNGTASYTTAIGKTCWDLVGIDPETEPVWQAHKATLDAHKPFRRFRYSLPASNGGMTHISISGMPIFDGFGAFVGYRGTAFNITSAVEARRRVQQAEALLRSAVDSISEGFVIFDADDRFVMCNAAYERLYSIVADEFRPGRPFEDLVRMVVRRTSPDLPAAAREAWVAQRLAEHRHPPALPVERQLWDGRWVLICERQMSDGGTAGLQIDITAQKKTQQALHQSQQRLARAQRIAGVGDVEHDVGTSGVTWSDQAYEIYGIEKGVTPSWETFIALIHPEDRERVTKVVEETREGRARSNVEYRIIRPDGEVRHLLRESEPLIDESGAVTGVASTVQDVTELRQSQERERELHAQLEHRQRLEALGTLAGGIAHDMNNTLVPILALSKRAMAKAAAGSRDRLNLETIYRASEHARDLVKQILTFSRKDSVDKKPVRLGALTHEALQMMRAGLPTTIALIERLDAAPLVLGDAGQLRQVIINLVTNAAQAIDGNRGAITVRAGASGDRVRLSVTDTGCGIDQKHLPRLFDPFFTTKEAGQGTGLGLSVVHGIVTAHGGRIDVESVPGQGATFTLVLPILAAGQDSAPAVDSAA